MTRLVSRFVSAVIGMGKERCEGKLVFKGEGNSEALLFRFVIAVIGVGKGMCEG